MKHEFCKKPVLEFADKFKRWISLDYQATLYVFIEQLTKILQPGKNTIVNNYLFSNQKTKSSLRLYFLSHTQCLKLTFSSQQDK